MLMHQPSLDHKERISLCTKIRIDVLNMIMSAASGHLDSSFSCVEILVSLYFGPTTLSVHCAKYRDRFILSKGHASAALYSVLAHAGFFPFEELAGFRSITSMLQGHPHMGLPGIDAPSGSLGQGLSIGCGMAWYAAHRLKGGFRTFVLAGDGDLNEGQTWEAIHFAGHQRLRDLVFIVDRNKIQYSGRVDEVLRQPQLNESIKSAGWDVREIDGHDLTELDKALIVNSDKPLCIIAYTIKGKGVSFFENRVNIHGKVPTREEYIQALSLLGGSSWD